MNNKILLWAALLLGGFVLLRRQSSTNASGVSVPIALGNFAWTGASDAAYWSGIVEG